MLVEAQHTHSPTRKCGDCWVLENDNRMEDVGFSTLNPHSFVYPYQVTNADAVEVVVDEFVEMKPNWQRLAILFSRAFAIS